MSATLFTACGETHTHSYTSQTTTEATCREKGLTTYTCSCGDTYTEEILALGHDTKTHEAQAPTCAEIGWKAYETCQREGCDYTTYEEIGELLLKKYKHIEVETLMLFLFDKKGRINREAIISVGSSDEAMFNMKNIVAVSASQGAYFAVVAHNHPSGNPKSSFDDKVSTFQIKEALENLNIN
jgi:DNA repair protein RadC